MPDSAAPLKIIRDGGTILVEFVNRKILDETEIAHIGDQLSDLIDQELQPKIIISFSGVDHLSSAALGTLITANNKIRNRDGQLRLSNIHPQIYEVFLITKLNNLFKIYPTIKEARDSLGNQAQPTI
ncbi:MAG TPA: STAS domain-containing protein [Phycisphaerae bacterium]|nr:STAS domain-containing protein [Phycisphaerae bacterium]